MKRCIFSSHSLSKWFFVCLCLVYLSPMDVMGSSVTLKDAFFPRSRTSTSWTLQVGFGLQYPFQSEDAFSPYAVPFSLSPTLRIYDSIKYIEIQPISASFTLIENGRNNVFESFGYGLDLGKISFDLFLHPRIHLHYGVQLHSSEAQHHVANAGLIVQMGVRIPIWYRFSTPQAYEQGFLHVLIKPLSVPLLGRLSEANLSGKDGFTPVLNGHLSLEWGQRWTPWLRMGIQLNMHINYSHWQSVLAEARWTSHAQVNAWLGLKLDVHAQWPIRPAQRREKVYNAYFLRYPSIGVRMWMSLRLFQTRKGGNGS